MAVHTESYSSFDFDYNNMGEELYEDLTTRQLPPIPDPEYDQSSDALYETLSNTTKVIVSSPHVGSSSSTDITSTGEEIYEELHSESEISPYGVYYSKQDLIIENVDDTQSKIQKPISASSSQSVSSISAPAKRLPRVPRVPRNPKVPPPPSQDVVRVPLYSPCSPTQLHLSQNLPENSTTNSQHADFDDASMVQIEDSDEDQTDISGDADSYIEVNESPEELKTERMPSESYSDCTYIDMDENAEELESNATDSESNDSEDYTYIESSDQAATQQRIVVPSNVPHTAPFGHLLRSVSAGQLTASTAQHNSTDQSTLQLNILIQMHQMLVQMQAAYAQTFSSPPQTNTSRKSVKDPQPNAATAFTKGDDEESITTEQCNKELHTTDATNKDMKKCLG